MANRTGITRRLPGNELGSILRETAREARRSTRDPNAVASATEADFAELQALVNAQQTQITTLQTSLTTNVAALQAQITALQNRIVWTVLATPAGGVGTWIYPSPYTTNTPVISATPLSGVPVYCAAFNTTLTQTQFVVWNTAGSGLAGVTVNLVAHSRD